MQGQCPLQAFTLCSMACTSPNARGCMLPAAWHPGLGEPTTCSTAVFVHCAWEAPGSHQRSRPSVSSTAGVARCIACSMFTLAVAYLKLQSKTSGVVH